MWRGVVNLLPCNRLLCRARHRQPSSRRQANACLTCPLEAGKPFGRKQRRHHLTEWQSAGMKRGDWRSKVPSADRSGGHGRGTASLLRECVLRTCPALRRLPSE
eukprot:15479154-Alexandrium_andersonii.AAC.1